MRILARAIRQFRSVVRHKGGTHGIYLVSRRHLVEKRLIYTCQAFQNAQTYRCMPPISMMSRALSADAVQVSNGDSYSVPGGPLVEYERRIASGELMDGDMYQVCAVPTSGIRAIIGIRVDIVSKPGVRNKGPQSIRQLQQGNLPRELLGLSTYEHLLEALSHC